MTTPILYMQGIELPILYDLVKQAVREVHAEAQQAAERAAEAIPLPDDVPATLAAQHCGWKTAKSLAQYHGHGLTPIYLGKRLFYKKKEVEALRKKRQNL